MIEGEDIDARITLDGEVASGDRPKWLFRTISDVDDISSL